jgi:hypothetical protein
MKGHLRTNELHERPSVTRAAQMVNTFSVLLVTGMFMAVLTTDRQSFYSQPTEASPHAKPSICNIRLNISLPSASPSPIWPLLFTPSKQNYQFLSSSLSATYLAHTILIHVISLIIFSDHKPVSQTLGTARSATHCFVADSSLKQTHNLHAYWQSSPNVL